MNKKLHTLQVLQAALERIIQGSPERISKKRKLSVRAVEEEASLGNGTGYYYPALINAVKEAKQKNTTRLGIAFNKVTDIPKDRITNEIRLKEKYKKEKSELKTLVVQMAAEHHHLNDLLRRELIKTFELEKKNKELKEEIDRMKIQSVNNKRKSITPL